MDQTATLSRCALSHDEQHMPEMDNEDPAFLAEMVEREAFEARFPPEKFARIAIAIELPPEPDVLASLRRSLLYPFYFFSVIGSGESLSRQERIEGVTELRDAARGLLRSLRHDLELVTVGTITDDPIFDPQFRATVRSIAIRADAQIDKLRSERGQPGRPRKDFWEILPDLAREYKRWTGEDPKKPRWVGGSEYAGKFYDFVVAVVECLRSNLAEPKGVSNLPDNPSAVGDGVRKRWPPENKNY
jgi:hypothetical protein